MNMKQSIASGLGRNGASINPDPSHDRRASSSANYVTVEVPGLYLVPARLSDRAVGQSSGETRPMDDRGRRWKTGAESALRWIVRLPLLVPRVWRNAFQPRETERALGEIEAALREVEAENRKLAMVATQTDNAVIITDPLGHIEWVNQGFTRITEYTLAEVLGQKPGRFLQGPDTDPATVEYMRSRLAMGEGFKAEIVNYSKSGRLYWLAIDVQPIHDDDGATTHFVAIESDLTERKQAEIALRRSHDELEVRVEDRTAELMVAYDATISGWSRALDLRDKETEGHSQRVTEMALRLSQVMGISGADLAHVRRGALMHDIGKMGIPDAILLKPGKLTDDEWTVMRQHPSYAYEWLKPIAFLQEALEIPHSHHEKWDGTGYPRGLKGEQIPLAARVFAAVDIWDALRSDRPYRAGWSDERVIEHIRSLAGTHLDPSVVDAFLELLAADQTRAETQAPADLRVFASSTR
jgi:PAS domain S-box-containing protein/putative nucleotidyltransferase with HDIG domain